MTLNCFIREPLYFGKIPIYPPRVRDLTTNSYAGFVHIVTLCQEDIWDEMVEAEGKEAEGKPMENALTPFEYLLSLYHNNPEIAKIIDEGFKIFTGIEVRVLPSKKLILFTNNLEEVQNIEDLILLNDNNYFAFQNLIRTAIGEDTKEPPNPNENPKIARMKAKARLRDRIKKKQKANGNSISLDEMLVSVCCMGIGITPLNIGDITYPALTALFGKWQEKEAYDLQMRAMTSGFGIKKKSRVQHWIGDKNKK